MPEDSTLEVVADVVKDMDSAEERKVEEKVDASEPVEEEITSLQTSKPED